MFRLFMFVSVQDTHKTYNTCAIYNTWYAPLTIHPHKGPEKRNVFPFHGLSWTIAFLAAIHTFSKADNSYICKYSIKYEACLLECDGEISYISQLYRLLGIQINRFTTNPSIN